MRHLSLPFVRRTVTAAMVLSLAGCFQDGGLNVDPNRSTSADAAQLFSGASLKWSLLRVGELTWPVALSTQMWSSGARWGLAQAQYDQTRVRSAWGSIYTDILKNLLIATKEAEGKTPKPNNTIAQLKIYTAFVYSQTTYLWGDIPFTEAATGAVDNPKFDTQQTVLNGTIALLDSAIAVIDANSKAVGAPNDLYYSGDMAKWRRFANSLKFRILMTMVDADPTKSALLGPMQGLPMIAARTDEMKVQYSTQAGRQNPRFSFTQIFRGGIQQDWYASNVVFAQLVPFNDPRTPIFYQPGPGATPGQFLSLNTVEPFTPTASLVNLSLLKADLPEMSFSLSEQQLLEAEAMARGFWTGGLSAADARYRTGVRESMSVLGVPTTQIDAFLPTLPTLTAGNFRLELNRQQYLDLFMRPLEAWVQWRRSGTAGNEYPALTVPTGALVGGLVRRLLYRSEEIAANPNTPKPVPLQDSATWFDK
jgi:Starch-binding associating with outer membrane